MATFVLVPGAWLGADAWRDVTAALREAGNDVHPLTLSGVAERASDGNVDLDQHTADVVGEIEKNDLRDVVLVAHSYGGMPVSATASRIPDRLRRVVYVDSGALPEGATQLGNASPEEQEEQRARVVDGMLPPPPFEDERVTADATPHPFASWTQPLHYTPDAPKVPTTLIVCTFPEEQVRALIAEGHPFFAGSAGAEIVALPTTHWPMYTEPKRLAELLDIEGRR